MSVRRPISNLALMLITLALLIGCGKRDQGQESTSQESHGSGSTPGATTFRLKYQVRLPERPVEFPPEAEPIVAVIHFRPYKGFMDTPVVPSHLINCTLISKLAELLEDPNYTIEKLKKDCSAARVSLAPLGLDILRKEGVKDSDVRFLDEVRKQRIAELEKILEQERRLDR